MDIRDYEYIVTIAQQQSITRAAAQLFITQPALTRFLQRVEKTVGMPLFLRRGNQFILTDAGQKYVETGRAIMNLDKHLTAQLEEARDMNRNIIRVGSSMGWATYIMKEILPAFYSDFPDVRIVLKADTGRGQMSELQSGHLDLALVANVPPAPGYTSLPMYTSHLALLLQNSSPLLDLAASKRGCPFPSLPFDLIKDLRYIFMPPVTNSGNLAREFFRTRKHRPNVVLEVPNTLCLFDAVSDGLGAGLCMTFPKMKYSLAVLSPDGAQIEQTAVLTYRSDREISAPLRHLMDLLLKSGSIESRTPSKVAGTAS